jgi:hypothetical protein
LALVNRSSANKASDALKKIGSSLRILVLGEVLGVVLGAGLEIKYLVFLGVKAKAFKARLRVLIKNR